MRYCKIPECKIELHDLNWHSARKNKKHYICNDCHKSYMGRYYGNNYTHIKHRSSTRYHKNKDSKKYGNKEWAQQYLASKRYWDKKKSYTVCDITVLQLLDIIKCPCTYCSDVNENIGLDRVDNTQGHTINNVVPACSTCNSARMNNLTFDEMKILGKTIKIIKESRYASKCV